MSKLKRTVALALLVCASLSLGGREVIRLETQADLDSLSGKWTRFLEMETDSLVLAFGEGTFFYGERFLDFTGARKPGTVLEIRGQGTTLVARSAEGRETIDCAFVDLDALRHTCLFSAPKQARFWTFPALFRKNRFLLPVQEKNLPAEAADGLKIILSQWFVGAVYPVEKIRNGFLYYRMQPKYRTRFWEELRYGRCLPRYMLCPGKADERLHRCGTSTFLVMVDCDFASVSVHGIRFLGNAAGSPLLDFTRVRAAETVLSDNCFEGIRSDVVRVDGSDRFRLEDNMFRDCYLNCVTVTKFTRDAVIRGNTFDNIGLMMTNAPVVDCKGVNFLVCDNRFRDYSYAAIGVGTHFSDPDGCVSEGVVEKNEISMSDDFRAGAMRELIDGGAIYIWTQNRSVVIRDNYIHDIDGPHGNRGIFGDDGVVNVTVCDNTVENVGHRAYAIDVRKAFWVQNRPENRCKRVNVGNKIFGNRVKGRFRAFIRKDDPDSVLKDNIVTK